MQILPVIDILDGIVVRGIAGRRADYRPIVSRLTSSSKPIDIAQAIREEFGLYRFYLADLDGILNQRPNYPIYHELVAAGFELLIDPGITSPNDAKFIHELNRAEIVVALETCRSPDDLAQIGSIAPRMTFSVDLAHGVPIRPSDSSWPERADSITDLVIQANVPSVIVLDLADVGSGTGGSTDTLCRDLRRNHPGIHLTTGGGIRGRDDLIRLKNLSVDAVLVASALHDGRLTRADIDSL